MSKRQDDLNLLNDQKQWTWYPVVPMINKEKKNGLVVAGRGFFVFEKNMYDLASGPIAPQLEQAKCHSYISFESMLDDGWECDC